jgi:hypothetical protein
LIDYLVVQTGPEEFFMAGYGFSCQFQAAVAAGGGGCFRYRFVKSCEMTAGSKNSLRRRALEVVDRKGVTSTPGRNRTCNLRIRKRII